MHVFRLGLSNWSGFFQYIMGWLCDHKYLAEFKKKRETSKHWKGLCWRTVKEELLVYRRLSFPSLLKYTALFEKHLIIGFTFGSTSALFIVHFTHDMLWFVLAWSENYFGLNANTITLTNQRERTWLRLCLLSCLCTMIKYVFNQSYRQETSKLIGPILFSV